MASPSNYAWRRDKEGLGVWEHRGKVAVAGYGHSPVDRRWDGVSMDKTLGAYSILACRKAMDEAGVTPDQIDGVICCDSHIAGGSGGSASQWAPRPYFAPPYDSEWGLTLVNAVGTNNGNTTTNTGITSPINSPITAVVNQVPAPVAASNVQTPVTPSVNTEVQRLIFTGTTTGNFRLTWNRRSISEPRSASVLTSCGSNAPSTKRLARPRSLYRQVPRRSAVGRRTRWQFSVAEQTGPRVVAFSMIC